MKAILEFNLPEDEPEYRRCNNATNMALVLVTFDRYLRGQDKYDGKDDIKKIRETFLNILDDYKIITDDFYADNT